MGEPADIVRRAFELANANHPDGLVQLSDPEIEFHDIPEIPGSTVYHGHARIREWLRTVHEISDDLPFHLWEVEEAGGGVLVETTAEMHGLASGAEVARRFWSVWRSAPG